MQQTKPAPKPMHSLPEQTLMEYVVRISEKLEQWKDDPANSVLAGSIREDCQWVADVVAGGPRFGSGDSSVAALLELARSLTRSGFLDTPPSSQVMLWLGDKESKGWMTRLAALLVATPWQWPFPLVMEDLPTWLWGAVARIMMQPPQGFAMGGQADRYVDAQMHWHKQVCKLARANPGSSAVRSVLNEYLSGNNMIPVYFSSRNLRELYELRGLILTIALGASKQETLLPLPREGRRLRVGFVNRHFAPQTETYTTLPTFEQLDPALFEVALYACHSGESELEDYARRHCASFEVLPEDLEGQLQVLRGAALDVVVFGTNVTATFNEITRLALFRVAPLQVVNNSSCTTTGLPQIDLYVSGELTEAAGSEKQFSERLGLLPGAAHAFNYDADLQEATIEPSRAALGIPEDCVLFASGANYYKVIPEVRECWARILAAVPGSRLLLHPFNPNWSSTYPIKRFCAEFDEVLARHGVGSERLVVSANKFPSRTDVVKLLSVADVYLDSYPFGGVNSLVDSLQEGTPTLVLEGDSFRSRMGAALLREIGIPELIVESMAEYEIMAQKLAKDATLRGELRERTLQAMQKRPRFLDTHAASQDFGRLLEASFDALCIAGSASRFKAEREVIRVRDQAAHGYEAHREAARLEGLLGNSDREVAHLMSCIETSDADGGTWLDLAKALQRKGLNSQAVQALETSLRMDAGNVEAWIMLAEIAESLGSMEMARDAVKLALQLAPEDERVLAIQARLSAC